jgi:hypothetical protein
VVAEPVCKVSFIENENLLLYPFIFEIFQHHKHE